MHGEIRLAVLRIAQRDPELRQVLIKVAKKAVLRQGKDTVFDRWKKFLSETVPNPDPDTRDKFKEVQRKTLFDKGGKFREMVIRDWERQELPNSEELKTVGFDPNPKKKEEKKKRKPGTAWERGGGLPEQRDMAPAYWFSTLSDQEKEAVSQWVEVDPDEVAEQAGIDRDLIDQFISGGSREDALDIEDLTWMAAYLLEQDTPESQWAAAGIYAYIQEQTRPLIDEIRLDDLEKANKARKEKRREKLRQEHQKQVKAFLSAPSADLSSAVARRKQAERLRDLGRLLMRVAMQAPRQQLVHLGLLILVLLHELDKIAGKDPGLQAFKRRLVLDVRRKVLSQR